MSFEPQIHWASATEKEEGEKTNWSNFWIMINTNQAGHDEFETSHLVTMLREAVNTAFSDKKHLVEVLNIMDSGASQVSMAEKAYLLHRIERVESEAVIEVGPKVHRIHAHVLLMVQHKTRVQLNVGNLRTKIKELSMEDGKPRFPNPIVRVKLIRENPLNAIRKYQRGYKNKLPEGLIRKIQRDRRRG